MDITGILLAWTGLAGLTALPQIVPAGPATRPLAVFSAVVMIVGVVLMWFDPRAWFGR